MTSRVKHDGDNDDYYDNDDDDGDEKEDLSHHEMIGHVVSGADVVRLSIHVNTWLLPDFNHQDGNDHNHYEVDINVGDDNGDCGGLDDDGILHLLLTLAMTIPREYEDDHQERI